MSDEPLVTCPTCGTKAPVGASFCGTCGGSLAWSAPGAAGAPDSTLRPVARPGGLSQTDSRNWALGAHLSALAGAFLGGVASFVGPLVVWLMRREDDAFAAAHALEALNFNLMTLGVFIIGVVLGFVTLGVGFLVTAPLLLVLGVLWLIWTIQAAMAASRGEPYRYPISIRFIQ